ncbi:hypothetical protein SAMN05216267_107714 [Actinacidiphila rubida]|uniref:Uncharacterized protein n=1 Tax=Actinacidiphila rubida TaxID=310780 RepID=A0A1H8UN40_9ACTN|nr:hypothetical protein SAMN05216267_107714 [Actinacidiphila rubida]
MSHSPRGSRAAWKLWEEIVPLGYKGSYRIKILKRQMLGPAGFTSQRRRILLA